MYSPMSKGIFLFSPPAHKLYKILYIYMLQDQITFFGAKNCIGHLPTEGF